MPAQVSAAGRIYKIQREDQTLNLSLVRDQKILHVKLEQSPQYSEFLIEGDIIAVTKDAQIVLLAPQRSALPPRTFDKALLQLWQTYLKSLREFFVTQDFLEIKTPTLVVCPGTEPSLDVFSTDLVVGSRKQKLFLPTSPELHLKKALALGAEKIFEMAPCFRNGEITERHQPEFLMLEWYRAYESLVAIKKDVTALVQEMAKALNVEPPKKISTYSVSELFARYCDFHLTPQTSKEDLENLAAKLNVDVHSAESIDDFFFLIFMDKIESELPADELIFVEKYPPYQAALARLTEDGWGDRFEAYWKGLELANAFNELNDPSVQRARAMDDLNKKRSMNKEAVPLDEEFLICLEAGMPPSGGIALGVERLFMALTDTAKIRDLRLFPF